MSIDFMQVRILVRVATQRTGAPVHDEDLEQEAMLRAIEAFRKRCDIRYPRAFLMKVVNDTVCDYWRRRRPSSEELAVLEEIRFARRPDFEDELDRQRRTELLRDALLQIADDKRATIELYYGEGRSIAEIARLQSKSPSAVKMQLMRARRVLAEIVRASALAGNCLEKHGQKNAKS
jgi:RNA polymerase sigma-70 factor (ECF subfamily)